MQRFSNTLTHFNITYQWRHFGIEIIENFLSYILLSIVNTIESHSNEILNLVFDSGQ